MVIQKSGFAAFPRCKIPYFFHTFSRLSTTFSRLVPRPKYIVSGVHNHSLLPATPAVGVPLLQPLVHTVSFLLLPYIMLEHSNTLEQYVQSAGYAGDKHCKAILAVTLLNSKQGSLTPAAQCRAGFEPCDERRLAEQKSPVLTGQTTQTGLVASYGASIRHGSRSDSAKHTML